MGAKYLTNRKESNDSGKGIIFLILVSKNISYANILGF
jgi:hypothetical protein